MYGFDDEKERDKNMEIFHNKLYGLLISCCNRFLTTNHISSPTKGSSGDKIKNTEKKMEIWNLKGKAQDIDRKLSAPYISKWILFEMHIKIWMELNRNEVGIKWSRNEIELK